MVASCTAIAGDGKWNDCLLGCKTTVEFWFVMIAFLRITSLSFIWRALLFLSETIFEMSSNKKCCCFLCQKYLLQTVLLF